MMGRAFWTPEEDEALRELYPAHGPSWEGWAEVLPGRGFDSLRSRARKLGLHMVGRRTSEHTSWAPEEDEALREHYPANGPSWEGWQTVLPGRGYHSIRSRAKRFGLRMDERCPHVSRGTPWTHEEDEALYQHYPLHGPSWEGWQAVLPGRSLDSRRNRMRRLMAREGVTPKVDGTSDEISDSPEQDVTTEQDGEPWTSGEVGLVRCHYPRHGILWDGWARQLPRHTTREIERKAAELGLAGDEWDEDEDRLLRELYPVHGPSWDGWETALPGRSRSAIRSRASHEGITYESNPYVLMGDGSWTELQMRILMRDLRRTSELCEHKVSECCHMALSLMDTYRTIHKEES